MYIVTTCIWVSFSSSFLGNLLAVVDILPAIYKVLSVCEYPKQVIEFHHR